MGNHDVVNFIDGEEALRKIENVNPDLSLMDIQLAGGLTGLDVVKQLRADGFDRPIIAVTAYAMVGDKERCIEAGCDDYLPKPIPVTRLVELFQHYQAKTVVTAASPDAAPMVLPAATQTVTVETAAANGQVTPAATPAVVVTPVAQPDTPAAQQPAESEAKSAPAAAVSPEAVPAEKRTPAAAPPEPAP